MQISSNAGRKAAAIAMCGAMSFGALALSGCASIGGGDTSSGTEGLSSITQMLGGDPVGNDEKTTRTMKDEDKNYVVTVTDEQGNETTNVILVTMPDSSQCVDAGSLSDTLNNNGVDWYQFIWGKSTGSSKEPKCYVYLSQSTTYQSVESACNLLVAAGYNASMVSSSAYSAYVEESSQTDIYYIETTVFGPAAQTTSE